MLRESFEIIFLAIILLDLERQVINFEIEKIIKVFNLIVGESIESQFLAIF